MSKPSQINSKQLENLLVTFSKLRGEGVAEEDIRKYAEIIVEVVKAKGIARNLFSGRKSL